MESIILASQSKGRRELLENEGLPITPLPADIDETIPWVDPPANRPSTSMVSA